MLSTTRRTRLERRRLTKAEVTAWRAFLRAQAVLIRGISRDLEDAGVLPLPFYGVLLRLSRAPEQALRHTELADQVFITKSGLTRLLDRMEEQGLVERRGSDEDRRGQYAVLTAAGGRALRRSAPSHVRSIARRFADLLLPRELAALTESCHRIAAGPKGENE